MALVLDPTPADPATSADAKAATGVEARVVDATLTCIARAGLGGLTIEEVALVAGVSRATIYRSFPSKSALVAAAVATEAERITMLVMVDAAAASDFPDAVVRVLRVGLREVRANAALAYIAEHESPTLYLHIEFGGGDQLLSALGHRLAPAFTRWSADSERTAEWVARVGLCLWRSPIPLVDPADDSALVHFVSTYVAPGLAGTPRASREED